MTESDSDAEHGLGIFDEPNGFYEDEKQPTFVTYTTLTAKELKLRLIGHSPLWGHLLWNAGRTLANYLEVNAEALIKGKTVLELGAGAGLPSLICALYGAHRVVVTDYPESDLIENLRVNVNTVAHDLPESQVINAEGYLWGASVDHLTRHLPLSEQLDGFDILILGDLLFNHSEHGKLVSTMRQTLKKSPHSQALVFFTPYRPWLLEKDLAFFEVARANGFVVDKILEEVMDDVMFKEDPGDELLRKTVFGYTLRWHEDEISNRSNT